MAVQNKPSNSVRGRRSRAMRSQNKISPFEQSRAAHELARTRSARRTVAQEPNTNPAEPQSFGSPIAEEPDTIPENQQPAYGNQLKNERAKGLQNSLMGGASPVRGGNANTQTPSQQAENQSSASTDTPREEEKKDTYFSRRLKELRKHKEALYKKAGVLQGSSKLKTIERYKELRNIIRVIKAFSLAGTSLGDVFFSLTMFLALANGELFYSTFRNPSYPFPLWEKMLTLLLDALIAIIILGLLLLFVAIVQFQQDPASFII